MCGKSVTWESVIMKSAETVTEIKNVTFIAARARMTIQDIPNRKGRFRKSQRSEAPGSPTHNKDARNVGCEPKWHKITQQAMPGLLQHGGRGLAWRGAPGLRKNECAS